jgi:hypothetical protein
MVTNQRTKQANNEGATEAHTTIKKHFGLSARRCRDAFYRMPSTGCAMLSGRTADGRRPTATQ